MRLMAGGLLKVLASMVLVAALPACEVIQKLAPPVIEDTTQAWRPGGSRTLTAEIRQSGAYEIKGVFLRYTRHHWPGLRKANEFPAVATGTEAMQFRASPPDAIAALKGDHLFWQWVVEYSPRGGSEVLSVTSTRRSQVVGCSEADTQSTLRALGDEIWPFATSNPQSVMPLSLYFPQAHGLSSLAGVGVTWANASNLDNDRLAAIGAPQLLFFAPRQRFPLEPEGSYMSAIGEPESADPPYRLVGAAWTEIHRNAKRRPSLGCIPSSEWFVHESGFHKADGRMTLVPPEEDFPGEVAVNNPDPTPGQQNREPNDVTMWHPRIWDLHVWLPITPAEVPFLSVYHPRGVSGIAPCANRGEIGQSCANRIFFFSETFE